MTAKELMQRLEQLPPDSPVIIQTWDDTGEYPVVLSPTEINYNERDKRIVIE